MTSTRLSRANEDKRAAESRLAEDTKERDRLATRVKTLERDLGTARKAKPPAQAAQAGEGHEGAEAPPGDRAGGGGGAVPPVSSTFWPGHMPGMARPRHAPARCRRCPPACGWPRWPVASRPMWTAWPPTPPR